MMALQGQQRLFSGRWTREEERYAQALMKEFREGSLQIAEGTSLRGHLASELQCGPKRISKKYEGTGYNGKQPYASRIAIFQHHELARRLQVLQGLRQEFLVSRSRVTAGFTGMVPRPDLPAQTQPSSNQRELAFSGLGSSMSIQLAASGNMSSSLGVGQLPVGAFSNAYLMDQRPGLPNARLGQLPRFTPLAAAARSESVGSAGSLLANREEYYSAAPLLFPTSSNRQIPLAVHTRAMEQSLLERVTEQSLIQQAALNSSLFASRIRPILPSSGSYASLQNRNSLLRSQLQNDLQQRHLFNQLMERPPPRALSSAEHLDSMHRSWQQEETKGQEESKRSSLVELSPELNEEAPARKRQRRS